MTVVVGAAVGAAALDAPASCPEWSSVVSADPAAAPVLDDAWTTPSSAAAATDVSATATAFPAGAGASAVSVGAATGADAKSVAVSVPSDWTASVAAAAVSRGAMPTFDDEGLRLIAKASNAAPTSARAPVATHGGRRTPDLADPPDPMPYDGPNPNRDRRDDLESRNEATGDSASNARIATSIDERRCMSCAANTGIGVARTA